MGGHDEALRRSVAALVAKCEAQAKRNAGMGARATSARDVDTESVLRGVLAAVTAGAFRASAPGGARSGGQRRLVATDGGGGVWVDPAAWVTIEAPVDPIAARAQHAAGGVS